MTRTGELDGAARIVQSMHARSGEQASRARPGWGGGRRSAAREARGRRRGSGGDGGRRGDGPGEEPPGLGEMVWWRRVPDSEGTRGGVDGIAGEDRSGGGIEQKMRIGKEEPSVGWGIP